MYIIENYQSLLFFETAGYPDYYIVGKMKCPVFFKLAPFYGDATFEDIFNPGRSCALAMVPRARVLFILSFDEEKVAC